MSAGRVAGLVLAGGAARRMDGADKPLLPIGGRPMLAWVIEALGLPTVAISANGDPARFARFGLPVLTDGAFPGHGPLAGVLAGLDWAAASGAEVLLTAPGDTPFLPRGLADMLLPAPLAAASQGRRHHLVAAWPVECAAALRGFLLSSESRRVDLFARRIEMRYREFTLIQHDPFANINTCVDLHLARLQAGEMAAGQTEQGARQ